MTELITSPSYTLLGGMVCGLAANLLFRFMPPVARPMANLASAVSSGPGKMVLVVRTDLGMAKGKVAAQCAHAAVLCYKRAMKDQPELLNSWELVGQTKVCLKVDSESSLLELAGQARETGLVFAVVRDAGRTQVDAGTITVLGIGPAPSSALDQITGHLKLY